jgi:hypothetical protein
MIGHQNLPFPQQQIKYQMQGILLIPPEVAIELPELSTCCSENTQSA